MLALIENQDQLKLLQEQPELIPSAVEEFLRWASPVYHSPDSHWDVELGGKQIKADDKVVMCSPPATGTMLCSRIHTGSMSLGPTSTT